MRTDTEGVLENMGEIGKHEPGLGLKLKSPRTRGLVVWEQSLLLQHTKLGCLVKAVCVAVAAVFWVSNAACGALAGLGR